MFPLRARRGAVLAALRSSGDRLRGAAAPLAILAAAGLLGACGGSAAPSMSLSPHQVEVTASLSDPAPTATVTITVKNMPKSNLYIGDENTSNGIASVTEGGTSGNTATVVITFKPPASLGVGTYDDSVALAVCNDSQCTSQIASSPQTVAVTYVVTGGAGGTGPSITSLSPSSATVGTPAFVLSVFGNGFGASSVVEWNGSPLSTTFVSTTELTAQVPASDVATTGTASVTVSNGASGTSDPATFFVQSGVPLMLASVSPSTVQAGGAGFVLTATGTGFDPSCSVEWNGTSRPTTYVSSTQLTAQIGAADIAGAGNGNVAVASPSGGASNSVVLTIEPPVPLALTRIRPSSVTAGGPAFTLAAVGAGFPVGATVEVNGSPRPTTYVSPTELTAQLSASDIATAGTASIAVQGQGTTSADLTLTIGPASADAVALQITPGHGGAINLQSVAFPATTTWTVDLGGPPSYALIADGLVYVTVYLSGNSQLVALDQGTGAVAWGPIPIAGAANAAYDAGTVFVVSGSMTLSGFMQAFDGATGASIWSAILPGQWSFSSGPTALNGLVYTGGAGEGGTLYALEEATGALAWTQPVANGDSSTPAVTADGVYVAYPYQTYDFNPATGTPVWHNNGGGDGGGGGTPVVANGLLYAPNGFGSYSGTVFDAEKGTVLQTYVADNLPAIGAQLGYFLQSGTLRGVKLATSTVVWSFAGDGTLVTSPIAVNQYVLVGSSSGNLYALDGTSGSVVWSANLGAALPAGAGWGARMPLSGLAAGDGLLVVPAGTRLTAFKLSTSP